MSSPITARTAPMMGTYRPKISSSVEPEMPGSTIAEMATIAARNTYTTRPTSRFPTATSMPVPDTGLSRVTATTNAMPATANARFGRRPHSAPSSSRTTMGMANTMNPMNSELTS